jgi:hypothetical protein
VSSSPPLWITAPSNEINQNKQGREGRGTCSPPEELFFEILDDIFGGSVLILLIHLKGILWTLSLLLLF